MIGAIVASEQNTNIIMMIVPVLVSDLRVAATAAASASATCS
jgi:hypothetical protein